MKSSIWFVLVVINFCACSSSSPSVFEKPATSLVNTQWAVVDKGMPVLAAFHYADGNEWVFLADVNPTVDVQVNVALEDLLKMDESLKQLFDLPAGWKATREQKGGPWKREKLK
jgi:hypothetical protein